MAPTTSPGARPTPPWRSRPRAAASALDAIASFPIPPTNATAPTARAIATSPARAPVRERATVLVAGRRPRSPTAATSARPVTAGISQSQSNPAWTVKATSAPTAVRTTGSRRYRTADAERIEDEREDEREPDRPLLGEPLEVQAVGVLRDVVSRPVLVPVLLERARARAEERMVADVGEGRAPEHRAAVQRQRLEAQILIGVERRRLRLERVPDPRHHVQRRSVGRHRPPRARRAPPRRARRRRRAADGRAEHDALLDHAHRHHRRRRRRSTGEDDHQQRPALCGRRMHARAPAGQGAAAVRVREGEHDPRHQRERDGERAQPVAIQCQPDADPDRRRRSSSRG